jgi:hypothetical protein
MSAKWKSEGFTSCDLVQVYISGWEGYLHKIYKIYIFCFSLVCLADSSHHCYKLFVFFKANQNISCISCSSSPELNVALIGEDLLLA